MCACICMLVYVCIAQKCNINNKFKMCVIRIRLIYQSHEHLKIKMKYQIKKFN